MKIRPDTMKPYFGFLKEAGRRLDPKTRAIISVITKVDNQTENGFKQYLTRALQIGVSPDEIVDSLLVAFPTLGLTKIIWAMDIILEMDLPEFQPSFMGAESCWHEVINESELNEGEIKRVACDGRELFIYKTAENIQVYDSRCPHQETNIPELAVEEYVLTCPKHGWKFDIKTGECVEKGDRPLRILEYKVEDSILKVNW